MHVVRADILSLDVVYNVNNFWWQLHFPIFFSYSMQLPTIARFLGQLFILTVMGREWVMGRECEAAGRGGTLCGCSICGKRRGDRDRRYDWWVVKQWLDFEQLDLLVIFVLSVFTKKIVQHLHIMYKVTSRLYNLLKI